MSKKAKNQAQSLKIPRIIILTAKLIAFISTKWIVRFAARLFTSPIKHKIPKREFEMDRHSVQEKLHVPEIGKDIVVYRLGDGPKKILLVHGWSGRGTQLVKFADALVETGFSVVSFDAPAHGKSPGKTTLMPEFIASILEIEKQYGPFEAAIGHSLGGMSLLNAMRLGLKAKHLVIIGSGDIIKDIFDDFVFKMELQPEISDLMRDYFEHKYNKTMAEFSASLSAQVIDIPVLVIHDHDDAEVPVYCAINIHKNLKNGQLMLTKKLGHRKILGDPEVIRQSLEFINA
ncbi:alpha/beta hydrolase [Flavobacterium sp.]|uniref:alpha/beta hydrolase n=1 Tax=Flavobacterium sp. TaxID=239 RepID=UPI0039E4394B